MTSCSGSAGTCRRPPSIVSAIAVAIIIAGGHFLLEACSALGFDAGYVPLVILAAGVFARVAAGPAEDMLNMTGNGGVSASTYLAIIVVNVALAIPLIALFGLNGAAIASAVAMALRALWLARAVRRGSASTRRSCRRSACAAFSAGGIRRQARRPNSDQSPATKKSQRPSGAMPTRKKV